MTEKTEAQKLEALATALADLSQTEPNLDNIPHIKFRHPIDGKGILWAGKDYTKQFVYQEDKIFSSETIDLAKGKNLSINNINIINETEIGASVVKSNLREVGRLKGLIVDGRFSVNNYLIYDHNSDRLGLGTDSPNAAFSIVDDAVEIVLGAVDYNKAAIGTYNSTDVNIITDNTTRITVGADGNIQLGSITNGDAKIRVHGSLGIGVNTIDARAKLHVNGAVKFNDNLHLKGVEQPAAGNYTVGDIVWNSNPLPGKFIGWVCTKAGNPGIWSGFGEIK